MISMKANDESGKRNCSTEWGFFFGIYVVGKAKICSCVRFLNRVCKLSFSPPSFFIPRDDWLFVEFLYTTYMMIENDEVLLIVLWITISMMKQSLHVYICIYA